jgi:tRNA pseudouridine38-40 synthase
MNNLRPQCVKYAAQVAYVGTNYSGWQRQPDALSVQQVLEEALQNLSSEPVQIVGAGRTDGGVHAMGQVASFTMDKAWAPGRLMIAANFHLPLDVSLMRVWRVPEDFHARSSALWREYRYFIWHGESCWPHLRSLVWWRKRPWDASKVREACKILEGQHDFRAFCKTGECPENSVRTLSRVRYRRGIVIPQGNLSLIVVRAPSFLTNMVRIIIGNLDRIGCGKEPTSWLEGLLNGNERSASGMTVPASGLYLWRVAYEEFVTSAGGAGARSFGRSSECSERI